MAEKYWKTPKTAGTASAIVWYSKKKNQELVMKWTTKSVSYQQKQNKCQQIPQNILEFDPKAASRTISCTNFLFFSNIPVIKRMKEVAIVNVNYLTVSLSE